MIDFNDYMKVDMHCHTSPSSLCSEVSPEELVDYYVDLGYGAIVLTNHYRPGHIDQFGCSKDEMLSGYLNDWKKTVKAAKNKGLKVFLGAEVKVVCDLTAKNDKGEDGPVNSEFLLYGTDEEFFYKTYNLYTLKQKELFEICNKYGVLVFQSHPLRDKHFCIPLDPRYMHGVEVFNPHFESKISKTLEIANNNKLLMSAGSDVHTLPATEAGLYIPKDITNEKALADYLRKGESIIFGKEGVIVYNGEQLINIEY